MSARFASAPFRRCALRLRGRLVLVLLPLLGLVALVVVLLWPYRPPDTVGRPAEPPYLTIFLIDGLSQAVFQEQLARGKLPEIAQLIREGTYVENGVSAFPSMTGYGYYPLITGEDAARSGALGLRWFDRQRSRGNFRSYVGRTYYLLNEDLKPSPLTLFENNGAEHSLTINSYCNRGAHHQRNTGWLFTMAKYKGFWWVADLLSAIPVLNQIVAPDWEAVETRVLELALADLERGPKLQWITFVSPDTYAHVYGIGPRYPELLEHIDRLIGRYRREAEPRGPRFYALLTDHGVETVSQNLDLVSVLAEHGVKARRGTATRLFERGLEEPLEDWSDEDAALAINGNLMNFLYLRAPGTRGTAGWGERRTRAELGAYRGQAGGAPVDLVAVLERTPGIELVVSQLDDGDVEVRRTGGRGRITRGPSGYAYTSEGEDPLRYATFPPTRALSDGQPHAPEKWLEASAGSEYPYGVVRLHAALTEASAADLVITSLTGYDLAKDFELFVGNYRGGHGGLRAAQTRVPYVLAGPGVPAGHRITSARAEDIGATLFQLLGQFPKDRDGKRYQGAGQPLLSR